MTGKDFAAQIKDYIATPLGLKNTFPSPGNSSKAVIPPVDNSWGGDYGVNAPGGGLVSSLSDISAFAHSILSRTILSPPETRAWLKPNSITGSPSTLVGLPWEIYRPPSLLPDHPSYVPTIYAKSGGAYGYRALLALLDSHGAALVLLTAGDTTAVPHMYDAMLASFVPALDTAAREQATAELAATFASPACSKLLSNSSTNRADEACVKATLSLNSSMELTSLTRDGKDIRTAMTTLWSNALGEHVSPIEPCYNLFPTEDVTEAKLPDGRRVTRESWRMWLAPVWSDPSKSDLPGQGIGSHDCIGWQVNDWLHYGGEPLDRFVVIRDEESGDVVGIEVPFLRSGILERASSGDDDGGEGHH